MNMDYTVIYTRKKKNPYLATSSDGLNQAFGKTKDQAISNLKAGIAARKARGE